jgi:hypothetical protein
MNPLIGTEYKSREEAFGTIQNFEMNQMGTDAWNNLTESLGRPPITSKWFEEHPQDYGLVFVQRDDSGRQFWYEVKSFRIMQVSSDY